MRVPTERIRHLREVRVFRNAASRHNRRVLKEGPGPLLRTTPGQLVYLMYPSGGGVARKVLFKQEKAQTCAVASLRSVLALQFEVFIKEPALEALGTAAREPIAVEGCDTAALRRMVKGASFAFNTGRPWRLTVRRHGRVIDLKRHLERDRYPLITVGPSGELHMIVCLAVRPGKVKVFDPASGRSRWIAQDRFLSWWGASGCTEYAVVTGGDRHVEA